MKLDMDYVIDRLEKLLNIPSPSGNTSRAIDFIEKEFSSLGLSTYRTNKGALIGTIVGENKDKEVT
ncbi:MAG: M42 family metallopeptidase, partial [Tissierellia bacterium]|nr:M42 family metallopeptidase [Tissierellia bacterium]